MAVTKHQVFAWVGAAVFIFTTFSFTGAVLWQMNQNSKREKEQLAVQKALQDSQAQPQQEQVQPQEQQPSDSDVKSDSTTQPNQQEGKLEGTKLKDFVPGKAVTQLQYIDIKEGTGPAVPAGGTITAHYTGALVSNGVIFQSSHDSGSPFTSPLSGLIKGWQDGIPGMKEGGTRRLIIPAADAYGAQERPGIPANSDLVFDIELVKVEASQ